MGKARLLLVFNLIALCLQPFTRAWSGHLCPEFIPHLEQSLHSLVDANVIQALRAEESHALSANAHALETLGKVRSDYAMDLQIHAAHQAQVEYCEAHNALVHNGQEKYELVPMLEKHIGEELGKSIEHREYASKWPRNHDRLIQYLSPHEADSVKVYSKHGKLHFPGDQPLGNVSNAIYVMDSKGEIFILDASGDPRFAVRGHRGYRHASPVRGAPVASAGTISFDEHGQIILITNHSGHYAPSQKHLNQFVAHLRELGVDLSHADVMNMH